jgi:hypothetical protein
VSQLDWKGLREAAGDDGISRVPDGWYDCVVKSTKVGQTANGYKKVNARFVVESGPYAGMAIFKDFIVTTDKPGGLKFFFRHMAVLGFPGEVFTDELTMESLAVQLVDRRAQVQVGTRVWNGEERAEVKDLKKILGDAPVLSKPVLPAMPMVPSMVPMMPSVPVVPVAPEALPEAPVLPPAPVLPVAPSLFEEGDLPPEPPF